MFKCTFPPCCLFPRPAQTLMMINIGHRANVFHVVRLTVVCLPLTTTTTTMKEGVAWRDLKCLSQSGHKNGEYDTRRRRRRRRVTSFLPLFLSSLSTPIQIFPLHCDCAAEHGLGGDIALILPLATLVYKVPERKAYFVPCQELRAP